jgi:hypothetical protein
MNLDENRSRELHIGHGVFGTAFVALALGIGISTRRATVGFRRLYFQSMIRAIKYIEHKFHIKWLSEQVRLGVRDVKICVYIVWYQYVREVTTPWLRIRHLAADHEAEPLIMTKERTLDYLGL